MGSKGCLEGRRVPVMDTLLAPVLPSPGGSTHLTVYTL